jgi:hypothetical protein
MFCHATSFKQNIGIWPISPDCITTYMFSYSGVSGRTFEGHLFGNKIAEYFRNDRELSTKPNELRVWHFLNLNNRIDRMVFKDLFLRQFFSFYNDMTEETDAKFKLLSRFEQLLFSYSINSEDILDFL